MKLRNKKTGEIFNWEENIIPFGFGLPHPKSLAELNEEWEDYKPTEPLIKDKNVRELVRNWLMINKVDGAFRHNSNALRDGFSSLLIVRGGHFENLKSEAFYTTEELCGEGEE